MDFFDPLFIKELQKTKMAICTFVYSFYGFQLTSVRLIPVKEAGCQAGIDIISCGTLKGLY